MREIEALQRGDGIRRQIEHLSQIVRQVKTVPERRQRSRNGSVEVVGDRAWLIFTERFRSHGLIRTILF